MKTNFILIFMIALLFSSCEKQDTIDSIIEKEATTETTSGIDANAKVSTYCDITGGVSKAKPNTYAYFKYVTDINSPSIKWSVVSGDITILFGFGNTVKVRFGPNFKGGVLKAIGKNGHLVCSDTQYIGGVSVSYTCPTSSCLSLNGVDGCYDGQARLACANDVQSVKWYYSIGSYHNVYIGTTTNYNNSSVLYTPVYLPTGNWDNYYMVVHAYPTLKNGTKCSKISHRVLLKCLPDPW